MQPKACLREKNKPEACTKQKKGGGQHPSSHVGLELESMGRAEVGPEGTEASLQLQAANHPLGTHESQSQPSKCFTPGRRKGARERWGANTKGRLSKGLVHALSDAGLNLQAQAPMSGGPGGRSRVFWPLGPGRGGPRCSPTTPRAFAARPPGRWRGEQDGSPALAPHPGCRNPAGQIAQSPARRGSPSRARWRPPRP